MLPSAPGAWPRFVIAFSAASLLTLGCSSSSSKKETAEKPERSSTVAIVSGQAGGTFEDTFTVTAVVRAVDQKSRKVTLEGSDGKPATFTAPPEVRNLDQLKVGDKVKATIAQQVDVSVQDESPGAAAKYAEVAARAPRGAKPGALVAESFETVAKVTAIDRDNRTATLKFTDGDTMKIPVREDVQLERYDVGDYVVIRVTEQLTVLVEGR